MPLSIEALVGEERENLIVVRRAKDRLIAELFVRPIEFELVIAILKNQIGGRCVFGPNIQISKVFLPKIVSQMRARSHRILDD